MQKKLLSLAIAGALAVPGAAMADVTSKSGGNITFYGKFHASYDWVDNDNNLDDSDDNTAVFRNSRFGLKGAEDLGNGLKAVWQIETHLDTDDDQDGNTSANTSTDNTGNVGLRNTFIGLQSDSWGTIFMGRHDTPYKTATAKLDLFSDTIADYNNIIGSHMNSAGTSTQSTFNERNAQLLAYTTPNINGFKAQVARESIQIAEVAGAEEAEGWSVMGMYDQGPFFASMAYEIYSGGIDAEGSSGVGSPSNYTAATANSEIDAWKLGLGYTFGNSKLAFVYEDIEHDNATFNRMERDAYWGAFSHKFGNNVVKLAYGKADDSDAAGADDGADNWSIGIDHNFSKRTKVYAIYTDMDNDSNGRYTVYNGDNASGYRPAVGQDVNAFSVGVIHTF